MFLSNVALTLLVAGQPAASCSSPSYAMMEGFCVSVADAITVGAPAAQTTKPAPKTTAALDVIPKGFAQASAFNPVVHASVRVIIENTTEDLWCPGIEVEWGDGLKSFHESDCAPYDKADPEELAHWRSDPIEHDYKTGSGVYTITARLKKGERMIRKLDGVVHIVGL